jgi:circadian clock protein KaiC
MPTTYRFSAPYGLEVLKQRGRAQLAGTHSYTITGTGATITPQLEVREPQELQPRPTGRMAFDLAELDRLMEGGLTAGTTTLLVGAPGVGKTTLGLVWALAGAEPTNTSVVVSFDERLPDLQVKAAFLGLGLPVGSEPKTDLSMLLLREVEWT